MPQLPFKQALLCFFFFHLGFLYTYHFLCSYHFPPFLPFFLPSTFPLPSFLITMPYPLLPVTNHITTPAASSALKPTCKPPPLQASDASDSVTSALTSPPLFGPWSSDDKDDKLTASSCISPSETSYPPYNSGPYSMPMHCELILDENPNHFVIFPIKKQNLWQFYKQAQAIRSALTSLPRQNEITFSRSLLSSLLVMEL